MMTRDQLVEKYVALKTERVIADAQSSTSYEQEIRELVEQVAEGLTHGELAEYVGED